LERAGFEETAESEFAKEGSDSTELAEVSEICPYRTSLHSYFETACVD
jgi:hypothetical protein